jgi:hydroxybutyrate-dimer hydrolase
VPRRPRRCVQACAFAGQPRSRLGPARAPGRRVRLATLNEQLPQQARFTFANTRVIAVGISNGGGAVLRAAELEGDWLDAVVAGEPNVLAQGHGARDLYDYSTEAALLMPCALPALGLPAAPGADARCAALAAQGMLSGADLKAQQQDALAKLHASGWTDPALRYAPDAHPCGFRYSALGVDLSPRAATDVERASWWADASGIPPGAGVGIVDPNPAADLGLKGLQCLRRLWTGDSADAQRVRGGIAETRAGLPRAGLPVIVLHGTDDGLVPQAFSSAPYVAMAQAAGRDVRYWQVRNAQHFDAFLGFPQYGAVYLPLLPYVYEALDRVDAHLDGKGALPVDAVIATVPRAGKPLATDNLAMPR